MQLVEFKYIQVFANLPSQIQLQKQDLHLKDSGLSNYAWLHHKAVPRNVLDTDFDVDAEDSSSIPLLLPPW